VPVARVHAAQAPECPDLAHPVVPSRATTVGLRPPPRARAGSAPAASEPASPTVETVSQARVAPEVRSLDLASPYEERLRSLQGPRRDEAPQKTSLLDAIRGSTR
jgi:hypothetical protein